MGEISLQEKLVTEIMNLPEDKIQMLLDFIAYLKFLHNKQSDKSFEVPETGWKKATEELIALSGICSSNSRDLSDSHDEYLYGSIRNEI